MNKVLGSLGVIQGSPQQTRLITPYADGMTAFVAYLKTAENKMRTMIYADTLGAYYDAVTALKAAGKDVKLILDHTQERGHYEHPHILKLMEAGWKDGVDFVVGTSPEAGQIIHLKSTWVDDRYVEDGSLNYSPSAFKQINSICIMDWPDYAEYLNGIFETQWAWILKNDQRYQEKSA